MPRTAWQRCGWRIDNYAAISICTTNPRSGAARAAPAGLPEPIRLCGDLRIRHGHAYSETVRQKRWNWYVDDFSARLKPNAKRILMLA